MGSKLEELKSDVLSTKHLTIKAKFFKHNYFLFSFLHVFLPDLEKNFTSLAWRKLFWFELFQLCHNRTQVISRLVSRSQAHPEGWCCWLTSNLTDLSFTVLLLLKEKKGMFLTAWQYYIWFILALTTQYF